MTTWPADNSNLRFESWVCTNSNWSLAVDKLFRRSAHSSDIPDELPDICSCYCPLFWACSLPYAASNFASWHPVCVAFSNDTGRIGGLVLCSVSSRVSWVSATFDTFPLLPSLESMVTDWLPLPIYTACSIVLTMSCCWTVVLKTTRWKLHRMPGTLFCRDILEYIVPAVQLQFHFNFFLEQFHARTMQW